MANTLFILAQHSGTVWYRKNSKCEWVLYHTEPYHSRIAQSASVTIQYCNGMVCRSCYADTRGPTSPDYTPDVSGALKGYLKDDHACRTSCSEMRVSWSIIAFHLDRPTLVLSLSFVATCKRFELLYRTIYQCSVNMVQAVSNPCIAAC